MSVSPTMLPRGVLRGLISIWARTRGARVRYEATCVRITKDTRVMLLAPSHDLYVPTMLQHFDTYWGAVRDHDGVVDFSQPTPHTYRQSGMSFWMSSMPEEPDAADSYFAHGAPNVGDTVYDIGANTGVTTYALAQRVGPRGRVIAFEPDPLSYEMLRRNILRHRIGHIVTAVPAAIADRDGRAMFNTDATLGATLAAIVDRHGKSVTKEVETTTLATAFARYGTPSFIKMDIEGAEIEALGAAVDVLRQYHPRLAIDTHHKRGGAFGGVLSGDFTTARVEQILRAAGYGTVTSSIHGGFWTTWARQELA